jgi:hypothetical protein
MTEYGIFEVTFMDGYLEHLETGQINVTQYG